MVPKVPVALTLGRRVELAHLPQLADVPICINSHIYSFYHVGDIGAARRRMRMR